MTPTHCVVLQFTNGQQKLVRAYPARDRDIAERMTDAIEGARLLLAICGENGYLKTWWADEATPPTTPPSHRPR